MKLRTSYQDFLLESILYTSDEFKEILNSIRDNDIADKLYHLINRDIKTNFNILKTTDKNDMVSFIPDSQATAKLKAMNSVALLLAKSNNQTGIGRLTRSILTDNGIIIEDKDLETFVNRFKAAFDEKDRPQESIRIVKGDDIKHWYLEDVYCPDTKSRGRGTLGKSCMRYEETQDFFEIYIKNPEVCSLVIKTNKDNQLEARALLWKTTKGMYLDRVYFTNAHDVILVEKWVETLYPESLVTYNQGPSKMQVQLGDFNYKKYPYMDSFPYYNTKSHILYNYEPFKEIMDKKNLLYLQDTDGGFEVLDKVYCEYIGEDFPSDEVIFSDLLKSYLPKDQSYFSEFHDSYIYEPDSAYSKVIDDRLNKADAILVYIDENRNYEWYPDKAEYRKDFEMDGHSGNYYMTYLLIQIGQEWYLKSDTIIGYELDESDFDKYMKIYNFKQRSGRFITTELDMKLFGFKPDSNEPEEAWSKRNFFLRVYINVIYDRFIKMIKELDADEKLKKQKIEEAEQANNFLMTRSDVYIENQRKHRSL